MSIDAAEFEGQSIRPPASVIKRATERPLLWIGALSFEERASASLVRLAQYVIPAEVVVLEYPSEARQVFESRDRRSRVRSAIRGVLGAGCVVRDPEVDPYSFYDLQEVVREFLSRVSEYSVVLDISCLTKIHAIALAELVSRNLVGDCEVAYTVPENYGHMSGGPQTGWRDVIVVPFAESARLLNEDSSRGIVIPGHEPERLIAALAELEPSGGAIVVADAAGRPDFRAISERRNRRIVSQLLRLRTYHWERTVIRISDWSSISQLVQRQVIAAESKEAPVILFPYGPKPLVMAAALSLARSYEAGSWFVYPIPVSYDVNYSEGQGETLWFHLTPDPLP